MATTSLARICTRGLCPQWGHRIEGSSGWDGLSLSDTQAPRGTSQRTYVLTIRQDVSCFDRSNVHSRDAIWTGRVPIRGWNVALPRQRAFAVLPEIVIPHDSSVSR